MRAGAALLNCCCWPRRRKSVDAENSAEFFPWKKKKKKKILWRKVLAEIGCRREESRVAAATVSASASTPLGKVPFILLV